MYADIIIKNGRCVTMCGDGGADRVDAAGRMSCGAGRGEGWEKRVRPGTKGIGARGGTVLLPGDRVLCLARDEGLRQLMRDWKL